MVVVTGASAGLGRAIALGFAKKGLNVGLISRNEHRLETLKEEIEALGVSASFEVCDVADANQIFKAADALEKTLGPIDIWVNNAMASVFSPFEKITVKEFKRVTDVTYLGVVFGTHCALKKMLKRNRGTIIQVGSALAYRGIPLQSAYCGAKHAIQGFTESLRCELLHAKKRIKITMVQMPALNTPQFSWVKSRLPKKPQPVPPIFQPEVGANAIIWAAFHYRREWYVANSAFVIILNKFFPGSGDRYLAKKGFSSQQYDGRENVKRSNNLFKTVNGPFGIHGDFNRRAKSFSFLLWIDQRIKWIFLFFLFVVIILISLFI